MNTSNITNYKPKDFAELLGVSVKTLQRWDREGTLKANRTPTDRRYYTYNQYLQFKGIDTENDTRQVVIYARVSTRNQKDDLQNQVSFLRQFCNARGMIVDQCIEDYGSGLNYNRKKWNHQMNLTPVFLILRSLKLTKKMKTDSYLIWIPTGMIFHRKLTRQHLSFCSCCSTFVRSRIRKRPKLPKLNRQHPLRQLTWSVSLIFAVWILPLAQPTHCTDFIRAKIPCTKIPGRMYTI